MSGEFPGARLAVVGLRVVGEAVVRAAQARGIEVLAVDDSPTERTRAIAGDLGIDLVEAPGPSELLTILSSVDSVILSPGIPETHHVHRAAQQLGVAVGSEYDLAAAWDSRPCLAVTGTDGKTTVTTLITDMLIAAGQQAVLAGNADVPLVTAIDDDAAELFVVEASSFGLGVSTRFAPRVGTWLNLAPDHQDAHIDLDHYANAKARIWQNLDHDGLAIANAQDPVVMAKAALLDARVETFGLAGGADWTAEGGALWAPGQQRIIGITDLPRSFPHDLANLLAAAATAHAAGVDVAVISSVASSFRGLPHRVTLVGEADGVRYYDDSKATTPHATLAALQGFESTVLLAGGHNKGLDLTALAAGASHIRSVVAIGAAADEVVAAFDGLRPVLAADSMDEAVRLASREARSGDAVLLSPGCASFDWYGSYAERGDDFVRAVREIAGVTR